MQYGLSVPASHRRCQSVWVGLFIPAPNQRHRSMWDQSVWVIHTGLPPASSVNVGYPYLPPTSVICLEEGMPYPTLHKESLG